ncbi:hypothetical protein [Bacillus safensis]|uniref:hypothetical protein n=1 Tax=Bacillus safensis TaxID=561879 RepID=UPI002041BA26|nr:hypothetical protein [Bacillus safensis]MCM3138962.1 hypothetical protein [Bacillus safensis]MCZ2740299.1 hypothetical protein [Bacillus safensis]
MQEDIKFENGNYIVPEKIMKEVVNYIDELKELAEEMHATIQEKDINSEWGFDLKIKWPHISIEKHYCCVIGHGEPYHAKRGFREIFKFHAEDKCRRWVNEIRPGGAYHLLDTNCDNVK